MSSSELSAQTPGAVDPGYTTTEFWQTVFVNVIASGVAVGSLFSNNFMDIYQLERMKYSPNCGDGEGDGVPTHFTVIKRTG